MLHIARVALAARLPARAHHAAGRYASSAMLPPASAARFTAAACASRTAAAASPSHLASTPASVPGGSHRAVRSRALVVAHAKIPAKKAATYSTKRMRASDEFVEDAEDDDYDEYTHMGRPNKTALKRLMREYANLTAALCELPKTSIAKIPMPDDLREEVYQTIKVTSNIARKRALGRVAKLIRNLDDEDALPIQTAVENLKNGVGLLTVAPEVEATATMWRDDLLNLEDDEGSDVQKQTQSFVFSVLQHRDDWVFTRQELAALVTVARKEKKDAKDARDLENAERAAADAEAIVMPDGTTVPRAAGAVTPPVTGKRKNRTGKSSKKLLKHLRTVAEVAHADGLV
jgi:ribosomal 50S subunit-associated protein YjgA (DUF615 family)